MRTHHYPLLLAIGLIPSSALAQAYGELDLNDVRARFYAHGLVGYDVANNTPVFEVPQGGGASALYAGGLWLVGVDSLTGPHGAAMMYEPAMQGDFYPGPLTTDGSASISTDVMNAYDQVWSVTREEIAAHLAYFNCLSDPGCDVAVEYPDGYETPASILNWPAINGNVGYSTFLAPFFDFNNDGDYTPSVGDAPCILGDEALFHVFNDKGGPHMLSAMQPMGIEMQAMPFAYIGPGTWKDQTVFVRYHIINRSTLTLDDTRIGFFNDFDLGCPEDDRLGADPSRNLAYIYNGDDLDENCLGTGAYGAQPPAFGQVILKGPLLDADAADNALDNTLPSWNGEGFGDGQVDNERSGISKFMYINRDGAACCNDPAQSGHFYNYLNGYWKDGTPLTYGEMGYSADPNATPCSFTFPGADDPVGAGTAGQPQTPWADDYAIPGDRRGLGSTDRITLEPGEHVDLLIAYVYARASSGGAFASVAALQARVDSVRAFANTLPIWNTFEEDGFNGQCADYVSLSVKEETGAGLLYMFPVPAGDHVQLTADPRLAGELLLIHDATGRIVATHRLTQGLNDIDISSLARGVYSCEVRSAKARYTGRLVKE